MPPYSLSKCLMRAADAGRPAALLLMATLTGAWAQPAPSINTGGIVNAASSAPGAPVAPGSIVSVYGSFPLSAPSVAPNVPLPTSLGGLSLAFGAVDAPLFYASATQVNLQVPWEMAGQSQASLTATAAGQTSAPKTVNLGAIRPRHFQHEWPGNRSGSHSRFLLQPDHSIESRGRGSYRHLDLLHRPRPGNQSARQRARQLPVIRSPLPPPSRLLPSAACPRKCYSQASRRDPSADTR